MGQIDGKFAVVTGGGKGIGRAVVERFLKEGAAGVAILDYDEETAKKTQAELADARVMVVKCDVSSSEMVKSAFAAVYAQFGRIDILVNNAGLTRDAMIHKMTEQQWDTVLDADLKGTFLCTQQVVPAMKEQLYGKIVNIASVAAYGNIGQANYAAAKAGVMAFTAVTARELAAKNITANCISPGFINTDILKTIPPEVAEKNKNFIPMKRVGEPEELAKVVLFLSSDESSYVTGVNINANGGMRISY